MSRPSGMYGFQRLDLERPELVVEPMFCGALDCSKPAIWHVWQTHDLGGGFLCTACFHGLIDKGMDAPEFTELALEYVYE